MVLNSTGHLVLKKTQCALLWADDDGKSVIGLITRAMRPHRVRCLTHSREEEE